MHKSSSLVVILSIFVINQHVYCGTKSDDQWWNHLMTGQDSQPKSQWTTIGNSNVPELTAQSTNRSVKRSNAAFQDKDSDSPVRTRSRNWEKSYARKRDFDRTWSDGQPIRDRFVETEWDDDVPVRHVFKDSMSAVDEGSPRIRMGDDVKIERMSRVWTGSDDDDEGTSFVRSSNSGRNNNNNNNNNKSNTNNNKPKAVTNSGQQQQGKSDRTDRVLSLNFQDPDSKKKDRERLEKLAKQIFNMDGDNTATTTRSNGNMGTTVRNTGVTGTPPRSNGYGNMATITRTNGNNGNGYVSNAVNSFTRNSGNSYVSNNGNNGFSSTSANGFNRNTDKTNTNKLGTDLSKAMKPKVTVMLETTPKSVPSNTAKSNANDVRKVADMPKSMTTPSAPSSQLKSNFGWRSSITHANDQKLQTQNQKLQESSEENDNFEDIEEDEDDMTTTTPRPTRGPITRPPTRTTMRPTTRATMRPTFKPTVEYTTYRMTDTTRPQTTTSVTNKPNNRETTILTTRPPKLSPPKVDNSLAPNKKQHRMGSWVDSDSLDYEMGDNIDCGTNCPISDENDANEWNEVPIDDRSQPIRESEELVDQQLPERVENPTIPVVESPKFARQSAATAEREDQTGWSLEDALPGVPGTDYPTFATVPKTSFDCKTHEWPGYYADVEAQCQVFHICQTGGRKNSFLCPNGTMFNQQVFVCDWWHNVQCGDSVTHYPLNEKIYDHNWESKRVPKSETEGSVRRSGSLKESAEPLTDDEMGVTTAPMDSELMNEMNGSTENNDNSDDMNERSNDFGIDNEEDNEETGRASRVRSPIRLYRTSRFMTPLDRQKRRRRKRGYLKA